MQTALCLILFCATSTEGTVPLNSSQPMPHQGGAQQHPRSQSALNNSEPSSTHAPSSTHSVTVADGNSGSGTVSVTFPLAAEATLHRDGSVPPPLASTLILRLAGISF